MGLTDWMLKHGIAQMDPEPEPSHKDWPQALTDDKPKDQKK